MVPMINLSCSLAIFYCINCVPVGGGGWGSVGVSSGCLGLALMFYITYLLWFVGMVPMINLSCNFCYMYCVPGVGVCGRV